MRLGAPSALPTGGPFTPTAPLPAEPPSCCPPHPHRLPRPPRLSSCQPAGSVRAHLARSLRLPSASHGKPARVLPLRTLLTVAWVWERAEQRSSCASRHPPPWAGLRPQAWAPAGQRGGRPRLTHVPGAGLRSCLPPRVLAPGQTVRPAAAGVDGRRGAADHRCLLQPVWETPGFPGASLSAPEPPLPARTADL